MSEWECSFARQTDEYKITYACVCGEKLVAHFGFKQHYDIKKTSGYLLCPSCTRSWYYEVPLTFTFTETRRGGS